MSLLLRLAWTGLMSLASAALGWWLAGQWLASVAMGALGAALAHWLYHQGVVRPLRRLAAQAQSMQSRHDLVQSVIDHAPVLVAIKDMDGRYLMANAEFERLHEITAQHLLGKSDLDFQPQETALTLRANDRKVLESGEKLLYQVPILSRGRWHQMEAIKFPLYGPDQRIRGVGLVATDVTELAVSQEKFLRVFHASPDWIVITRLADSVVIDANDGFERISGHSRSAAIGHPISALRVWVRPEQRATLVEALQREGSVRDRLAQMRRADGEVRDVVVNATLITLEGQAKSHAVWIARDVTQARAAETALRESEARFVNLFEMSPLPMSYSFDSNDYATSYRNTAFYETFGYSREGSHTKSAAELGFWVHPEDGQTAWEMRRAAQPINNWVVEVRCADGSHRWVSIFARVIVEPHRKMIITTVVDITEQRRAQQEVEDLNAKLEDRVHERTGQLRAANTELSQALRTLGQAQDHLVQSEKLAALGALVAGVAHELNTPIGNGLTVASALEDKARVFAAAAAQPMQRSTLAQFTDDTRTAADILVRNLQRAATLISSFKQVAVDRTSSQRRRFDLRELLEESVIALSPSIRRSGCEVLPGIEPGLTLDSYPGPLGQVLTNLINNALVHGFAPGQRGRIDISASALGADEIQISVRDNGRGIDPAHVRRVFEPFFTTRLGQGGSGLGLHIVHNIVTGILGGRVDVHSSVGAGAQFVLRLPVNAPQVVVDVDHW